MSGRLTIWLVVTVCMLVSAGCGSGAPGDSGAPGATPTTAITPTEAIPTPTTSLQLTAEKAADAFAGVAVPANFRADIRCPSRAARDKRVCNQATDADTAWVASLTYLGENLPKVNRLSATVVMNVVTAKAEKSAAALYGRQVAALRTRTGPYKNPVTRQAGGYTPGQQGRGTVTPHNARAWQGIALRDRYVIVFEGSTSGTVTSGTYVLRRGTHVLTVSWSTGDARARSKLSQLPNRVTAALDQAGRS